MFRIRRFGVLRTATVVAVAYAIVFLVIAIPLALLGLAAPRGGFGAAFIGFFLFVLLVVYPLIIWVFTALACLVYNLAARFVGGIEVEVERRQEPWMAAPTWSPDAPPPWGGPPPPWGGPPPGSSPPGSPPPGSTPPGWGPPPSPGGWPPPGGSGTSNPPPRP